MEYLHLWLRDNTQSAEALSSMVKNLWSAQTGLWKNEAIAEGRELYWKIQTHNP